MVGSGQSGAQLAEELARSGRDVVLATSWRGRLPRRYRGEDMMRWAHRIGFYDRRADALPSPKDRFAANAHLSGTNGGHTLNLHRFARDGIRLAGRLAAIDGHRVTFADDLQQNLRAADAFAADLRQPSRTRSASAARRTPARPTTSRTTPASTASTRPRSRRSISGPRASRRSSGHRASAGISRGSAPPSSTTGATRSSAVA